MEMARKNPQKLAVSVYPLFRFYCWVDAVAHAVESPFCLWNQIQDYMNWDDDKNNNKKKGGLSSGAAAGIGLFAGVVISVLGMFLVPWVKNKIQSRGHYQSHSEEVGVEMGREAV